MMAELVESSLVPKIFKLNLPIRLICDNSKAFPIFIKCKRGKESYTVAIELGGRDIHQFKKTEIELKGRIDIEYLYYRGNVELTALPNEPGYYIMDNIKLYKHNHRRYKRVPYRRLINIIEPINEEATLINFSASGAMINSSSQIQGDFLKFAFTLNKKYIAVGARILEQRYDENLGKYVIRCHFEKIDEKTKRLLLLTVREIVLQAKRRLQ